MGKLKKFKKLKSVFLVGLCFVFVLILSACGESQITREEALNAINVSLSSEEVQSVKDYTAKIAYEIVTTTQNSTTVSKRQEILEVDYDNQVALQTSSSSTTIKQEGVIDGEENKTYTTQYYIGNIDGVAYKVNDKDKVYESLGAQLEEYISYSTNLTGIISAPTEGMFAQDVVSQELFKTGDNSYELSFVFVEVEKASDEQTGEQVATGNSTVIEVTYKIEDGKISSFQTKQQQYTQEVMTNSFSIVMEFNYVNVDLTMPTTTLDGYTMGSFDLE